MENNTGIETSDMTEGQDVEGDLEGAQIEQEVRDDEAKEPAWKAFFEGLRAHAESLGLQMTEQKGFIKLVNGATQHKLYIAKGHKAVKRVDTTLPILGRPNTLPLEKPNGKIECHIVPEVSAVNEALDLLASEEFGKLRAAKRQAKAEGSAPADGGQQA